MSHYEKRTLEKKWPFSDAVALWHMSDLNDTAGENSSLTIYGEVKLGVELKSRELEDSLIRGGDGYVAEFRGGWLFAGQGFEGELNVSGQAMTLCMRLHCASALWNAPLCSKHGGDQELSYSLSLEAIDSEMYIEFKLGLPTPANSIEVKRKAGRRVPRDMLHGVMRVSVPAEKMGPSAWHDVIARFTGPKLELFVDGVLVDEEWPVGSIRQSDAPFLIGASFLNGETRGGFYGLMDHVALWNRALSDLEVIESSGGTQEVMRHKSEILGEENPNMQYWRPRGHNTSAGDAMPFYHEGTFHLFYLFDRRHHKSKWGCGAHQWAHTSTKDLVHWEHHPKAVPITEQWEMVGTGSIVHDHGVYYAIYYLHTNRLQFDEEHPFGPHLAVSEDGIHFQKTSISLPISDGNPEVFRDETNLFHLIQGSTRSVSGDIKNWKTEDFTFLPVGDMSKADNTAECPSYFEWNGWHYVIMGKTGFWMSKNALGPYWKSSSEVKGVFTPKWDIYDGLTVPKVSSFTHNRRILTGFLLDSGYGGNLVFRELVQHKDGNLGMKFPPEMIPRTSKPLNLFFKASSEGVTQTAEKIRLKAPYIFRYGILEGVSRDFLATMRVRPEPGSLRFGLCMRGSKDYENGCELRFEPGRQRAQWGVPFNGGPAKESKDVRWKAGDFAIENVKGLDRPFTLEIVVKGDIFDACIDKRRTMITRRKGLRGDQLFLFAQNADVTFDSVEIKPLLE